MAIESSLGDMLVKVGVFILVQALVYLIISKSSTIFSNNKVIGSCASFKTVRSVSIRRMLSVLADMPAGGEPSPLSKDMIMSPTSSQQQEHTTTAHHHIS